MPNHSQIQFKLIFNSDFLQFIITKTNRLYTWGASPQLIRLLNQSKKRARLAQKFEETKHAITSELEKSSESPTNDRKNGNEKERSEPKDLNKNIEAIPPQIKVTNDDNQNATIGLGEKDKSKANIEERIKNFLKAKTAAKSTEDGGSGSTNTGDGTYQDDEYTEHFLPSKVDTDDVAGIIVQVLYLTRYINYYQF